jgi:hypothetical protein
MQPKEVLTAFFIKIIKVKIMGRCGAEALLTQKKLKGARSA